MTGKVITYSHTEPLHALHSKVVSLTFTTVVVALLMRDPGKQYANDSSEQSPCKVHI